MLPLISVLVFSLHSEVPDIACDAKAVNSILTSDVGPSSQGCDVVRVQIALHRAHFSCGEIDGRYGRNLQNAIMAFQRSLSLRATGTVGEKTWRFLNRDAGPMLIPYMITYQDIAGPFQRIPRDMIAKSKLDYLGYSSPLEALCEKFRVNPRLLRLLNLRKTFSVAGQSVLVPNVFGPGPGPASSVDVSGADSAVTVVDSKGKIIAHYPASTGSGHDPLPVGEWSVIRVSWYPKYYYNPELFWDADPTHSRAVLPPGPRSPVGVAWISLSKEHYGIHGTPEPSRVGYSTSHGCIRLANWDISEFAQIVSLGIRVRLTR